MTRNKILRQPGFTLIETLMAFVILAVVLGASLVGSRALSQQAKVTNDQAQMSGLADEAIGGLRLLRDAAGASGDLGTVLGIPAGATSLADRTVEGFLVGAPNAAVAVPANNGPIVLSWLKHDPANLAYNAKVSPVGVSQAPACGTYRSADCTFAGLAASLGAPATELIALRKADVNPWGGSKAAMLSLTNPADAIVQTRAYTSEVADWNFYLRNIKVIKSGATYTVTVKVQNFYDKQSVLERTVQLTDYYN